MLLRIVIFAAVALVDRIFASVFSGNFVAPTADVGGKLGAVFPDSGNDGALRRYGSGQRPLYDHARI